MPNLKNFVNCIPEKDIPRLEGKVIFVTGGTAGLGKASLLALDKHEPAHVYFSGRNGKAASCLIAELKRIGPSVGVTFIKMDMNSVSSGSKPVFSSQMTVLTS